MAVLFPNPSELPEAVTDGYMRFNTNFFAWAECFNYHFFTNEDNGGAPEIIADSIFSVNGCFYKAEVNEAVTGGVSGGINYVYAVPNDTGCSFIYSNITPELNAKKGGYYNGNNRAIIIFNNGYLNKTRILSTDRLIMEEV